MPTAGEEGGQKLAISCLRSLWMVPIRMYRKNKSHKYWRQCHVYRVCVMFTSVKLSWELEQIEMRWLKFSDWQIENQEWFHMVVGCSSLTNNYLKFGGNQIRLTNMRAFDSFGTSYRPAKGKPQITGTQFILKILRLFDQLLMISYLIILK